MSANNTSLADTLPISIPPLDPSGKNWPVFLVRFHDAIEAKGYWGHFDGTKRRPRLASAVAAATLSPAAHGSVSAAPASEASTVTATHDASVPKSFQTPH